MVGHLVEYLLRGHPLRDQFLFVADYLTNTTADLFHLKKTLAGHAVLYEKVEEEQNKKTG